MQRARQLHKASDNMETVLRFCERHGEYSATKGKDTMKHGIAEHCFAHHCLQPAQVADLRSGLIRSEERPAVARHVVMALPILLVEQDKFPEVSRTSSMCSFTQS